MAGLTHPLRVRAYLHQGIAIDTRRGLALDSLLVSAMRTRASNGLPGSQLDGGLSASDLAAWDIPLDRCTHADPLWHWQATSGQLIDFDGCVITPRVDAHRLLQTLDEQRAHHSVVALPQHVGGSRGRFRQRITPVLTYPAAAIEWHACGDPEDVSDLVSPITAIGARRGSGEGSVRDWEVTVVDIPEQEWWAFAHLADGNRLGRPVPQQCAERLGVAHTALVRAGLRPPMFHPSNQHHLVLPE